MTVVRFLRSPGLTLAVCILTAALAAVGTLLTPEDLARLLPAAAGGRALGAARLFGLVDTSSSPLFLSLVILLVLNILFCVGHRLKVHTRGHGGVSRRLTLDVLLHLALVLMLGGASLRGLYGFTGTQYLFLDVPVSTVSRDGTGPEEPLGFTLLLRELATEYYPLLLRIGVRDARTGEKRALLEVREGESSSLPGADLRVEVAEHGLGEGWVGLRAAQGGRSSAVRLEIVPGGRAQERFGEYSLELVAWRRDVKAVRGRIAVIEGGREAKEEWLSANGRVAHRGTSVFLTAWGEDKFLNPYLGIQVSRDPGAYVFWGGAVVLIVTMPLFVLARHGGRATVARPQA